MLYTRSLIQILRRGGEQRLSKLNSKPKILKWNKPISHPQGIWSKTSLQGMPYPVCAHDLLIKRLDRYEIWGISSQP